MKKLIQRLFSRAHQPPPTTHRYALHSGERQTGRTLAEIRFDHVARYQLAARLIAKCFAKSEAAFGLDAFCGTGYGTRMLADQTGCAMLGIDASDEAIQAANVDFSDERTFFTAKLFPFCLPARAFDFIVCLESVEHVEHSELFIDTLAQALKPGGLLVISTPNLEKWSLEINPNSFHFRHFSRRALVSLIEDKGDLRHFAWYGQDIYQIEAGRIGTPLNPQSMEVRESYDGQILILVFQKSQ